MVFLKEMFEKLILKKVSRRQINHEKLPNMQILKLNNINRKKSYNAMLVARL